MLGSVVETREFWKASGKAEELGDLTGRWISDSQPDNTLLLFGGKI